MMIVCGAPLPLQAYPLDGYEETGIRRLEASRRATEGFIPGPKQPPGAMLPLTEVEPRLLNKKSLTIPAEDPEFTRQITELLGSHSHAYGIAVLDLTDPDNPRYAEHREDYKQNVGSVGKLVVALAIFQALADNWPDVDDRKRILKTAMITADSFSHSDHHTVRLFDMDTGKLTRRPLQDGDTASVYEYLDWMVSPSSNSAAGMLMRDAMLMRQFGDRYPVSEVEIHEFFATTPKKDLTALFRTTFYEPLERNGFDLAQFRQGSFFTHQGKRNVPGAGNSYATARQLMRYGLLMEQGELIDEFSSREIKRLLYVTERRIRYASAPSLNKSAVYFKSGSLYSCQKEEGFHCGKYKGNVKNYMNSFAIVESPAKERKMHYLVMLISNVLRKNSAYDHQALAKEIHKIIEAAHPEPPQTPQTIPSPQPPADKQP
ncbi:serine hydrolase [Pseudomaricurvus sp.]|uniref:serine hydrolase n=1 Tax=Pseudomaricurvus sp. TaxID=2004510 RepID=UPI003F6A9E29